MAATSSPAATLTAIDVLKRGGNAIDAAIAASAILCLTEPHMTGIGGDCFALLAKPDGSLIGLNGAGRSAAAATPEWLAGSDLTEIATRSVHAVTAPGAVDAWDHLLKAEGSWSWTDVLAPAISLAEAGMPVQPRVARDWAEEVELLRTDEGSHRHHLMGGHAPNAGDLIRYPALAQVFRAIAARGRAGFYEGDVAADIIGTLRGKGSLLTESDLATTEAEWVKPISTGFRDATIHELPPSGQGLTVLIALNILKHFGLSSLDPEGPQRRHLEVEALKRAWVLRNRHISDPGFADVPVAELLSDTFAARLAASIDPGRASDMRLVLPPSDTVYIAVVDRNRFCVSFINSIYWSFGSGITTAKTGITLQNRGAGFSCDPGHPNVIGPRKRPLHTIIPAIATKAGRPDMVFGVMGGDFQPMGHVNVVLNRMVFGMDPQEALDFPRLVPADGVVEHETSLPDPVRRDLEAMGHVMVESQDPLGGGQIIAIDHARGLLIGGSDPRKDGFAAGY